VILYNRKDENENWIPMKVEANSWVTLMLRKTGVHAKDAKKHRGHDIDGCYKVKVLKFGANANSVAIVYIQHAYQWRQLQDLNIDTRRATQAACNCTHYHHPNACMFFDFEAHVCSVLTIQLHIQVFDCLMCILVFVAHA